MVDNVYNNRSVQFLFNPHLIVKNSVSINSLFSVIKYFLRSQSFQFLLNVFMNGFHKSSYESQELTIIEQLILFFSTYSFS